MDYRGLIRKRLLEDMYDKMSDDDKRLFVQLSMQDKGRDDILQALNQQNEKIDDVSRRVGRYPFASNLAANIGGNLLTDGLIWFGKNFFKKL